MIDVAPDAVLHALDEESSSLVEYALDVFLEYDFNDHSILDGSLTGGHIVTYVAREADRMADELLAATGQDVPDPDRSRRWELSENGNLRPGAVMVDDIHVSTERLREAISSVPQWSALEPPVRDIPQRRLLQLVVHLVDLGRPWDQLSQSSAQAAVGVLPDILHDELAGYRLVIDEEATSLSTDTDGMVVVKGPARKLLAWATGRDGAEVPTDFPTLTRRVWI